MKTWKIGVDGGGTKTECILLDPDGNVAARRVGPGCNPSLAGYDRAPGILRETLESLVAGRNPPPIGRTLLCLAGNRTFWTETAAAFTGLGSVETAADSLPTLELATGGAPGLVVHAGTGSFWAARAPDGSLHYAGGLGWRFGDAGSGHDLGRRGIARALLELQGWAEPSPLAEALCQHTGVTGYAANSRSFYSSSDADQKTAAFAPRVVALAAADCAPARRIIAESLAELARLADAVLARLFPAARTETPVPLGVSGKLLNETPCFQTLRTVAAEHSWPVQLLPVTEPPIEGVRRLLLRRE